MCCNGRSHKTCKICQSGDCTCKECKCHSEKSAEQRSAEILKLQELLEEEKNKTLLEKANAVNIKRRAEQQVEKAYLYCLEKFSGELLQVVDNLERAISSMEKDLDKNSVEGIELTYKNFIGVLDDNNIKEIKAEGERFNPELHEAVTTKKSEDHPPQIIISVLQKGYTINGRLLRPCLVVVSS